VQTVCVPVVAVERRSSVAELHMFAVFTPQVARDTWQAYVFIVAHHFYY